MQEDGEVEETGEVEEEETSHGKAGVAGMMEKTGMEGMIPRMAKTRSTPAGTVTAGGATGVVRRLT